MPSVISGDANVSATEFGYLDGVTSALQTQIDSKANDSALGLVKIVDQSLSAVSTLNVNNCFSSTYANYLITSNITTSANTGVAIRLRASGSDDTTSNYGVSYRYAALAANNPGDANSTGQTQFNFHISNLCRAINFNLVLFDPQAATYTTGSFNNINADNGVSEFYFFAGGCAFRATTQFDGFSIYTGGAPTMTGTIRVYGIKN